MNDKTINTNDGMDIKSNFRLEMIRFSLGKNKEKLRKAKGAILVAAKLILTQNNFHEGSLNK